MSFKSNVTYLKFHLKNKFNLKMNSLLIGIGQAGSTIASRASELLFNINEDSKINSFINPNRTSCKCFLIDSEEKVIKTFINSKSPISKYFSKYSNFLTNSSGRGSNWALGHSLTFKEFKKDTNINIECFEKLNSFLEKCDFISKIYVVHSLGGGTGSGVGTRLLEMINESYPKIELISCPVFGFNVEKTTLSQFNTFFSIGYVYPIVSKIIRLDNEFITNEKNFKISDEIEAKLLKDYIYFSKNNDFCCDKYYRKNKFIDIGFSNEDYVNNVYRFNDSSLNKKIFHNKGNINYTCDAIFKTNLKELNEHKKFFQSLIKDIKPITNNVIYSTDKKIKNNRIDLEFFYKSNNIKWMNNLLNTVSKYIQQGYVKDSFFYF